MCRGSADGCRRQALTGSMKSRYSRTGTGRWINTNFWQKLSMRTSIIHSIYLIAIINERKSKNTQSRDYYERRNGANGDQSTPETFHRGSDPAGRTADQPG